MIKSNQKKILGEPTIKNDALVQRSCIVSVLSILLILKYVPVSLTVTYFKSIDYLWLIPSMLVFILSFFIRVFRWRIILSFIGKIKYYDAFYPLMIGFMANCLLPGRLGEFARPVILRKKNQFKFSAVLSTVFVERMMDMLMLIGFLIISFSLVNIDSDLLVEYGDYSLTKQTLETIISGIIAASIMLMSFFLVIGLDFTRKRLQKILFKFPQLLFQHNNRLNYFLTNYITSPLIRIIDNIETGMQIIKKPGAIFFCIALSAVIWGLQALSYYFVSFGCPGIELSFLESFIVMIIICIFISLPSVPGFWGVWEAGGIFALALFSIEKQEALGFTLLNHSAQILIVILIGLFSILKLGSAWRSIFFVWRE